MTCIKECVTKVAEILQPEGFIRRSNAFFLIKGEGIYIVFKIEKERTSYPGHPHFTIRLGLFSMLSKWHPQHFTSSGCIPRYSIVNLIGERMSMGIRHTDEFNERGYRKCIPYEITIEEQINILADKGIPFIRHINNQEDLLRAMCQLDEIDSGGYYGLDMNKYAPLLAVGKNKEAESIIRKLLELILNKIPIEDRNDISSVLKNINEDWKKESTLELYRLLEMAKEGDEITKRNYLEENYRNNISYAKEKLKWRDTMQHNCAIQSIK